MRERYSQGAGGHSQVPSESPRVSAQSLGENAHDCQTLGLRIIEDSTRPAIHTPDRNGRSNLIVTLSKAESIAAPSENGSTAHRPMNIASGFRSSHPNRDSFEPVRPNRR